MAIYITQGKYTSEAVRGLVAKPEDRTEELRKLAEAAGGKLLAFYYTLGEYDFLSITEHDDQAGLASLLAAAASGTVSDLKTTTAVSGPEMVKILTKAGALAKKFRPAGK
ncbi:MAG: GYD domain-containing protein [Steroidobacteraceae bacterium]|jgi:uncharacterized protein with GYD domain